MSSPLSSISRSGSENSTGSGCAANGDSVRECIGLDAAALLQALQDAHRQLNSLKAENSELRQELASLRCKIPQGNISSASNLSSDLSAYDEEITKFGKVFMHCFSLWINPAPPSPFCAPCPSFQWNSQDRYLDADSITSGPTSELYACVPPKFHDYMGKHEWFQDIFMASVSSGHSNMLLRARTHAALIFNMTSTLFETNPKGDDKGRMANNPELVRLLGYKPNGKLAKEHYPSSPPVLFANDNINAVEGFLKNKILISCATQMGRLLAYGLRALNGRSQKLTFNRNSPLHSDPEMNKDGIGKFTGINYFNEAEAYKKQLIENQDSPIVWKLLDYWNVEVFPSLHLASNPQSDEEDDLATVPVLQPQPISVAAPGPAGPASTELMPMTTPVAPYMAPAAIPNSNAPPRAPRLKQHNTKNSKAPIAADIELVTNESLGGLVSVAHGETDVGLAPLTIPNPIAVDAPLPPVKPTHGAHAKKTPPVTADPELTAPPRRTCGAGVRAKTNANTNIANYLIKAWITLATIFGALWSSIHTILHLEFGNYRQVSKMYKVAQLQHNTLPTEYNKSL
ncbi:uncharacterized protein LACBIDRAFT_331085 [Laccaria bicolor S238N-H82]|uniref:Predicted protein n=1 Tax=Laccaria bicolor (strain S238N-H82 / ATCC MYA-4686) TaxID=486041 RepID=B0DNF0_LACBS|nr:uncharacterized protein LACBIDRAFT_331085 [Laccaria bicolor S238N-H82]EDR03926.1 predicted protein [Laccaria bicolor S238N-H82]|eukprot:XP_001885494.1 predicted protein [Laccaria bicolor S238N-H82]